MSEVMPVGAPERLSPKTRTATIQDVARAAGVSKMTVSFALNGTGRISEQTKQAVLQAAAELNFRPNPHAKNLSHGRCGRMIGLFSLGLNLGAGIRKTQCIQRAFMEKGYEVPLHGYSFYGFDEKGTLQLEMMRQLCAQRPLAVVCNTSALKSSAMAELRRYQEDGGFVVVYDEPAEGPFDQVLFDRAENTASAVRHLVELGHTDIVLAGCNQHRNPLSRYEGFHRTLLEFGLTEREECLFLDLPPYEEGGAELARRFLAMPNRPTALCIVNDYIASTFVLEVQRAGLQVPRDVSVVSLDNLDAARYAAVPLTAASQPIDAISEAVVELLMSRVEGRYSGESRRIVIQGDLVIRESTAPPAV
jgi:DNA-binding LacI/PurR family transcriptional regulator